MDSALKQRLLGAAVLIALAIIFVPMFFSGTPPKTDGTTTQNLSIPPAPERNFETRNLSVDPPKPGAAPAPSAPPAAATPASGDKLATVDTGAPASFEAPDSATKPAPAAKPTTTSTSAPTSPSTPAPAPPTLPPAAPPAAPAVATDGRFLVNLGVYADASHASALVDKMKKLGYPAFAEATEYQGKPAQRVRVGPYAERASAENVRLKIKQIDAKLPSGIAQTGDTDKPAAADAKTTADAKPAAKPATESAAPAPTLPANRAGAYVVQAGAFKAEDEANKLRDRLRNGGVAAFVEKSSDGETTFWKVRAGPYADRSGADAAVTTLKQKFQVAAIVKTQP
ncbi:SPOR domain-containing protein [Rudaea sp.]|uniref:SPOR domain-containing protein n=1 Tax=Rudaea sp. TaxID=2136325 RepID=UPI002ED2B3D2